MVRLLVIYQTPDDPAEFDRRYVAEHVPLAAALPGLLEFSYSRGPVSSTNAGAAPYLIASLAYADEATADAANASPEGQAAVANAAEIATGGMTVLRFVEEPAAP